MYNKDMPNSNTDEKFVADALRQLDVADWPTYHTIQIPSYSPWPASILIEARLPDGRTSGLCRTAEEADARARAIKTGGQITEAPHGQANRREMAQAWDSLQVCVPRDEGRTIAAVRAALAAGIHTVEWAIASRHIASMFA